MNKEGKGRRNIVHQLSYVYVYLYTINIDHSHRHKRKGFKLCSKASMSMLLERDLKMFPISRLITAAAAWSQETSASCKGPCRSNLFTCTSKQALCKSSPKKSWFRDTSVYINLLKLGTNLNHLKNHPSRYPPHTNSTTSPRRLDLPLQQKRVRSTTTSLSHP